MYDLTKGDPRARGLWIANKKLQKLKRKEREEHIVLEQKLLGKRRAAAFEGEIATNKLIRKLEE